MIDRSLIRITANQSTRFVYAVVQANQNVLLQIGSGYRQISWRIFVLKQKKRTSLALSEFISLFSTCHFYKGHKTFYN